MCTRWRPAYVAIGSNLRDPAARVLEAYQHLGALSGVRLLARSRAYRSRPLGPQDQPDFVNAVAGLLTTLAPRALLQELLTIERRMGRERGERWGPRIVDLDLLWMPDEPIAEPGFTMPHPGIRDRNFVLYPLHDVAPTLSIPGCGRVRDLMQRAGEAGLTVLQ
ncbi:MAG: 2-amino-4-hydroxy-6-hydroxymethyldihydropteridine diphosphokinase [Gammaproteobacteria bacterium]|nr:2-amino-4-hydroxy-6-hydroxymethyldihydropteridine diphosphokinase [Gammaproteobacteria bacterium]